MKLKSLYIDNFGSLSNFNYNFSDSLNCIKQKNGYGKSTLAAFIKAMLYGMETTKENDKDFKDRKHYAPFNGNRYGGTLIFEHNNKEYRVERTFDEKSSVKDKTRITVDGHEKYFECLGLDLLGLDKESYERLLFLNEKTIKMESTGNIKQNLSTTIDETIQGVNSEEILKTLNETKKLYTKAKNNKIYNIVEEKKELKNTIYNQKDILDSLSKKKEERNVLKKIIDEKETIYNEMKNQQVIKECFENYESKINSINYKKEKLNCYNEKYKKGVPTKEEINALERNYKEKENANLLLNTLVFDKSKKEELDLLEIKYKKGYPTSEEIKRLENLDKTRTTLKNDALRNVFNNESRFQELKLKYKNGFPTDEELNTINSLHQEYTFINYQINNEFSDEDKTIKNNFANRNYKIDKEKIDDLFNQYKDKHNESSTHVFSNKKTNKVSKSSFLVLIGALILIISGLCLIQINISVCIVLIVLGVITLLFSAFIYFKSYIDRNEKANISVNKYNINEIKDIEEKIKGILIQYGIYSNSLYEDYEKFTRAYNQYNKLNDLTNKKESLLNSLQNKLEKYVNFEDVDDAIKVLNEERKTYISLVKEFENYEKNKNINEQALKENEKLIKEITYKYDIDISSNDHYYNLCSDINKIQSLKNEYILNENKITENKTKYNDALMNLENIINKYELNQNINSAFIDELKNDYNDYTNLSIQIKKEEQEALDYKKLKGLDIKPNFENVDLKTLKIEVNELKNQLIKIDQEINNCEIEIESLDENKIRLEEAELKEKEYKNRLKILTKTEELLIEAQKKLDDKYVSPIKNKFNEYEAILSDALNIKIDFTRDFKVLLEVNGKQKSSNYLSTGQTSICSLCFRLALLDNIFKNNTPFIIMDDPFSFLDEYNFASVKLMLTKNFHDKQIIYFTCHESRLIK